ncbi:MAG: SpoIIIAH-like family protein [Firmicutes bacterium]|nr:SpoIIIAH-like family protein [Bacillota bacterium]
MINKQGLWFLTLFSLILVLSVYYITMPNELLLTNNSNYTDTTSGEIDNSSVTISESETLVSMRVSLQEERNLQMAELKSTLTSAEATADEKNTAYEQIKYLTDVKGKEEALEEKVKEKFNLDCFIKIDNNEIKVVVIKKDHDSLLANQIMMLIQEEFENKVYVTVRFEK